MPDIEVERKNFQALEAIRFQAQQKQQQQEKQEKEVAAKEFENNPNNKNKLEGQHNRLGAVSFVTILLLCVIADILELATGGTIGWVAGLIVDFILLIFFGFRKGSDGTTQGIKSFFENNKRLLAAIGVETIPFVGALPVRTVFIAWYQWQGKSKKDQQEEN
jgi:hypothetical protein